MTLLLKVAEIDELPPGKGKTVTLHGRQVTVYNREGRYVATATMASKVFPPVGETTCTLPGHRFDTGLGESPDRLQADDVHYQVIVDEGRVFVVVE